MSQATPSAPPQACPDERPVHVTKSLLGYGVLAGVVYLVTAGVQAATRTGFDPARHDVSLLANGPHGWIQVVNFVVSGLMVLAAAVGARRALAGRTGGTWGPVLLGVYGLGLVAAGAFTADPAFGFPVGAPAGPAPISWHGAGHLIGGAVGFAGLIAACFVFARHFAADGHRGWAGCSIGTGVLFAAGFAGIASGSGSVATTVAFTVAVLLGWLWLAAVSIHLYRRA
jgi:hypothetical protein